MTDETLKPKRNRRRWIIVGVLLFVASAGWWNWLRGDQRFVGKWEVHDGQHIETWHLTRNGGLHSEVAPNVIYTYGSMLSRTPYVSNWSTNGERFYLGKSMGSLVDPILVNLSEWCRATFGFRMGFYRQRWFEIEWLDDEKRIYLKEEGSNFVFLELRRIHE